MLLAMFVVLAVSFFWTQYANPGIRKLAGVKTLLRNAADEMTLVLTDVEGTQALSQWNPSVSHNPATYVFGCGHASIVMCENLGKRTASSTFPYRWVEDVHVSLLMSSKQEQPLCQMQYCCQPVCCASHW